MDRGLIEKVEHLFRSIGQVIDDATCADPSAGWDHAHLGTSRDAEVFERVQPNRADAQNGGVAWLEQENLRDLFTEMSADFEKQAVRRHKV